MEFLDSNIFVNSFYENPNTEKCQKAIEKGGITDCLVLAETFNILEKIIGRKEANKSANSILKSHIQIVNLDMNVLFLALKLTKKIKISIYDCIHYICAQHTDCNAIISFDKDFNNLDIPREEP